MSPSQFPTLRGQLVSHLFLNLNLRLLQSLLQSLLLRQKNLLQRKFLLL
jgi:hypothetical protein